MKKLIQFTIALAVFSLVLSASAQLVPDPVTLDARACNFGYRDSIFKQGGFGGLAGKSLITRVRLRLPRPWQPVLGYLDLQRRMAETGDSSPDARTLFEWVCAIRRAKLPLSLINISEPPGPD